MFVAVYIIAPICFFAIADCVLYHEITINTNVLENQKTT